MSALPTLTAVTSMQFVVTLMDLTLAHVKAGIQEMEKVVTVSLFCFIERNKFGNHSSTFGKL